MASSIPSQSARATSLGTREAGEHTKWTTVCKGINIEEQPILDMLDFGEQDHANDMPSVLKMTPNDAINL